MSVRRVALALAGLTATALALFAVLRPGLLLGIAPVAALESVLSTVGTRDLLLGGGILVGAYVVWIVRAGADERLLAGDPRGNAFDRALVDRPEAVTVGERTFAAASADAQFSAAAGGDDAALAQARERLSALAAARLDAERDVDDPEAAVAAGDWTDDRTAAAFLATDDAVSHSLGSRVRLWLDPPAERERRLRRTVAAIESLEGDP